MATDRNPPQVSDLLVPFEIENIPAEYRQYYSVKRNNFFATIQKHPELWSCYLLLDRIWLRAIEDLNVAREAQRMFPLILYLNAHAKIRVSMELAFCGCMAEGRSILRDAVECVAHAHRMVSDPELQKTWLSKNDGRAALEAFKDAFERKKSEGVFAGLDELHRAWGQLSEMGSHATANALCDRFVSINTEKTVEFRLNYCGVDHRVWAPAILSLLLTDFSMEKVFFSDHGDRLKLDPQLVRMRAEFEQNKEAVRTTLIQRYNIPPPAPASRIIKP